MEEKGIGWQTILSNDRESNLSDISKEKVSLVKDSPFEPKIQLFWNRITLENGITKLNYLGLLIHYFLLAFIFVTVESLQPMLIQQNGTTNANLLLADIITKVIFAPIMGICCDRFGRRNMLLYGVCVITLAVCIMPLSANIYPQYLLIRILYAHGAITIAIIPLLADYVEDQTKGRGAGINVVLASLGAVFSVEIIGSGLQNSMSIASIYWLIGGSYILTGSIMCSLTKPGLYFHDKSRDEKRSDQKGFNKMMKIGVDSAKNPWILIGYMTNFFARGDSILLTLFMVLWSNHFISDYDDANIKAETLSGVAYTVILIFSIIYGFLLEKQSKYLIHLIMFTLTAIGSLMFAFANQGPNNWFAFLSVCVLGSGMSGLYTSSQYLINTYCERNHRGFITGIASLISVIGIFVCAVIGGYLFDNWSIYAPFILFGILSGIGILAIIYLWWKSKR